MDLTRRQKQIIDAALRLTAGGGIQNLTIKNLAQELNITEPAVYRHFKNKAEIIKTMILNFEDSADAVIEKIDQTGLSGIESFVKNRFKLVSANPPLAKVMFAEELFIDDENCSELMMNMMHSHRKSLQQMLLDARKNQEVRSDIELDMLFRIILGPVRLLIKQWAMSNHNFNLLQKGDELWDALAKVIK